MRVSCIQMHIEPGNLTDNLRRAAEGLAEASRRRSQVVLLPEMFNTGFMREALYDVAAYGWEPTLTMLRHTARKERIWIAGTVPEPLNDRVANTMCWVAPSGEMVATYRKVHLYPSAMEGDRFEAGDRFVPVTTDFGRLGGLTCFDVRFPEAARALTLAGCWAIFYLAQWPEPRLQHWITLLQARAIENQVWVVGANRTGTDLFGEYVGHSVAINPWGEIADGLEQAPGLLTVDLDPEAVESARRRLPALAQRRPDVY